VNPNQLMGPEGLSPAETLMAERLAEDPILMARAVNVTSAVTDAVRECFRELSANLATQVAEQVNRFFRNLSTRLGRASAKLRRATTTRERQDAARDFLSALAELTSCLVAFVVRVLHRLLSRLLGRTSANDVLVWTPVPLERTPEITPRGPNPAFPVNTHRGGHHRSTPGSVVLAA
jgi:hypothetical protein